MQNISSVLRKRTFKRYDYQFEELKSETNEAGQRFYLTPSGEKYPSVTTVLGSLTKDGIVQWRKRVGEEEANKITRRAANRGTQLHTICEQYILNNERFEIGRAHV